MTFKNQNFDIKKPKSWRTKIWKLKNLKKPKLWQILSWKPQILILKDGDVDKPKNLIPKTLKMRFFDIKKPKLWRNIDFLQTLKNRDCDKFWDENPKFWS